MSYNHIVGNRSHMIDISRNVYRNWHFVIIHYSSSLLNVKYLKKLYEIIDNNGRTKFFNIHIFLGAVVQPLPTSYLIFRAPSQAAGKCWMDALELSLRCSSLLVRSMSNRSTAGSINHETQWSEADYEKHFTDHGTLVNGSRTNFSFLTIIYRFGRLKSAGK